MPPFVGAFFGGAGFSRLQPGFSLPIRAKLGLFPLRASTSKSPSRCPSPPPGVISKQILKPFPHERRESPDRLESHSLLPFHRILIRRRHRQARRRASHFPQRGQRLPQQL